MSNSKLLSLTEIFNEKFFRIPDFQRGYSWQDKQLEDFWEDLCNLSNDRLHYTGLLTVEPMPETNIADEDKWLCTKGLKAYYLIDGQQRLTTSIILINEILGRIDDHEGINFAPKQSWINKFLYNSYGDHYKSYVFGYEKDNPSDEFFKTKILNQESSTSDKVPEQTLYTSNLQNAKEFFSIKLECLDNEKLSSLFQKLTSKFKFNFYEIDSDLDVFITFETMNNRGKALSNLELLKNRLIYLSTILSNNDQEKRLLRKDINETWKTIYEYLGKNKDKPLDDDDFLKNHWIMYFQYHRREADSYAKFLLNEHFTVRKIASSELNFGHIKKYIDSLNTSIKSWFFLFNPSYSQYSEETKEWIEKINRLGMGAFPPLLMASLNKDLEPQIAQLLQLVERFVFLVFRVTHRQSNIKNSYFYKLANDYFENNTTYEGVVKGIRNSIDGKNQDNEGNTHYIGLFNLNYFLTYISENYDKGDGFYDWSGLRYFLFEYELYLQNIAKGNYKVEWSDFSKRKKEDTIEHIYPQTPKDNCWDKDFNNYGKTEKNFLLNSLGNLLLLSRSKNSELQNFCFDYKVKHKNTSGNEVGYFNGSYSEIDVSLNKEWTSKEIYDRGLKMLRFLEHRWEINIEEWDISPQKLLGLDFIKE